MGNYIGCSGTKSEEYSANEFEVESEIREWEFKFKILDKSFLELFSKYNLKLLVETQKIPKSHVLNFFSLEFNHKMFNDILDNDIFLIREEKNKSYDAEKIKYIIFLLTKSSVLHHGSKIQDKAKYLYIFATEDEGESMIMKENLNLLFFVESIVTISCVTFVSNTNNYIDTYFKNEKLENYKLNVLSRLSIYLLQIVAQLIENIFDGEPQGLTMEALNTKFENDKWVDN